MPGIGIGIGLDGNGNEVFANIESTNFDGIDEDVSIGNDPSLNFTGAFSISTWVKPTSFATARTIFFRSLGSPSFLGYNLEITTGGKLRMLRNGGTAGSITTSTETVPTGVWSLVVCTKGAGTNFKLYIGDTETAYDLQSAVDPTSNTSNARIGGTGNIAGWVNRWWLGNLDEIALWNKELTSVEVTEILNIDRPNNLSAHSAAANIVPWWRMGDNNNFPIIKDNRGNLDGTMINMEAGDFQADVAP